jgi:hypothetical protein
MPEIELSQSQKELLIALTQEERDVVLDQMFERVREDLEWSAALAAARRRVPPKPPKQSVRRAR